MQTTNPVVYQVQRRKGNESNANRLNNQKKSWAPMDGHKQINRTTAVHTLAHRSAPFQLPADFSRDHLAQAPVDQRVHCRDEERARHNVAQHCRSADRSATGVCFKGDEAKVGSVEHVPVGMRFSLTKSSRDRGAPARIPSGTCTKGFLVRKDNTLTTCITSGVCKTHAHSQRTCWRRSARGRARRRARRVQRWPPACRSWSGPRWTPTRSGRRSSLPGCP